MADLAELRTFCTAADLGSLGRAAVRLHVTQPALSKRLQSLEAQAGTELLKRSPQGVALTPAGRRLYDEAQRLLAQADVVDDVLATLRHETQAIRVAASHTAAESFLPATLDGVELVIANSEVVAALVADGQAEVGLAAAPHGAARPGVRHEHLIDDEVVVAVTVSHPWARVGSISRREFLETPMVVRDRSADSRATVDEVLARHGLRAAPPIAEAGTTAAAKRAAREHGAPLLISRYALTGHGFVPIEVGGLEFKRSFTIVLPARGEPSPPVRAFIDAVRESVATLAGPGEEPAA
jgi:DNA-binding transcriptional LysR family regulator